MNEHYDWGVEKAQKKENQAYCTACGCKNFRIYVEEYLDDAEIFCSNCGIQNWTTPRVADDITKRNPV
jgi:hypothetical protein